MYSLALRIQRGVDRARELHPYTTLERQVLACCAEAGELAEAVAEGHGDTCIDAEAMDTIVTATRVILRQ